MGALIMKRAIVLIISLLAFIFLAGYEQTMADGTAVSNVSFTATAGSLTLTCVPSLRFEGRKREDGTDLAELASAQRVKLVIQLLAPAAN
jgi:hypothetical protein